jgi:outer membrane protein OmpA-like peptidoglycan-associated protein
VSAKADERLASTGSGASTSAPSVVGRLSFSVRFEVDSAALGPDAVGTLAVVARTIAGLDAGTQIEVVGHTDSTGSWNHNDVLSESRARAVQQVLEVLGVSRGRLTVRGAGEWEPVSDNGSLEGRAANRRVEFRFRRQGALVTR